MTPRAIARPPSSLLALVVAGGVACPQTPRVVKDVNTVAEPHASSRPHSFAVLGDQVLFGARDDRGFELWKAPVDGSGPARLVKDIRPGADSSNPSHLISFGSIVVFRADDGKHGAELWRSDGTARGTSLVSDLAAGPASGDPRTFTVFGGQLLFSAVTLATGAELFRSDGTARGTTLVRDIRPGPGGAAPHGTFAGFCVLGKRVYFSADDGVHGRELWSSDGTARGTRLVLDAEPGARGTTPGLMTAVGSRVFFTARTIANGRELWVSDPTNNRTYLVADLWPGPWHGWPRSNLHGFAALGDRILFEANVPGIGRELWISDGTQAGTRLVRDIHPGIGHSKPTKVTAIGGRVYFFAYEPATGSELWTSDGTAAGTRPVKDVNPGPFSSFPEGSLVEPFVVLGGRFYFAAAGTGLDYELWRSDGTGAGTARVVDLRPGPTGSSPILIVRASSSRLVFSAADGRTGREPWTSDGTAAGTKQLGDIWTARFNHGSGPQQLTDVNGLTFFTADDGVHGEELWKTDGTTGATVLVKDIRPGPGTSSPRQLVAVGEVLFFSATRDGSELWRSDGTGAGTWRVKDIHPGPGSAEVQSLTRVGETLFFSARDPSSGAELWTSDGTASGTRRVKDIRPGAAGSSPIGLTAWRGEVWFAADDGVAGVELWRSDGTAQGTARVADVSPGPTHGVRSRILAAGDRLFFAGHTPATGVEPFTSDGTTLGTRLVRDIRPGVAASHPRGFAVAGTKLYFAADDGTAGRELWVSDATGAGTRRVTDLRPGLLGSDPADLTALNGFVVFRADDGATGAELWRSKGTAATTTLVRDIGPGPVAGAPRHLRPIGSRRIFFAASDGKEHDLWWTDGTRTGTTSVRARWPRTPVTGGGQGFTLARGELLFAGWNRAMGFELCALAPGATAQALGYGCGTRRRVPSLRSDDPVLGSAVVIAGEDAFPNGLGALIVGLPRRPALALGGCRAFVDLGKPWAILAGVVPRRGSWSVTVPIVANTSLQGAHAVLQALFVGTDAPLGFEMTNGLAWTLGR